VEVADGPVAAVPRAVASIPADALPTDIADRNGRRGRRWCRQLLPTSFAIAMAELVLET